MRAVLCRHISIFLLIVLLNAKWASATEYDQVRDIVYGYKDGMALVMDVFIPNVNRNRAGIIQVMSGSMYSNPAWSHRAAGDSNIQRLLSSGYVVFAVTHSSQPRYRVDEMISDIPRAVRFIRHHAEAFGIDPERLGIMGYSSGATMALLAGMLPSRADLGARDPVDRESARLQAIVAYYPGTDNLNFGRQNMTILEHFHSQGFLDANAAFDFREWDLSQKQFVKITDPSKIREHFRQTSPITHLSKDDPPVLLFHGDKDQLVPIQQSKIFAERLRQLGIPYRLIVAEGNGHGWEHPVAGEVGEMLKWFDRYLLRTKTLNSKKDTE